MRKPTLALLLFFLASSASAQTCDCAADFGFLRNYMEVNHPGLNTDNRKKSRVYNRAADNILARIKRTRPSKDCILYLQQYITLLKDHHTSIQPKLPAVTRIASPEQLDSFFRTAAFKNEQWPGVDSAALVRRLAGKKLDDAEGLYKDHSGVTIAMVKDDAAEWPYKGIALAPSRTFKSGTVRFRLHPLGNGTFQAMVLLSDYQKVYTTISMENGVLGNIGLRKTGVADDNAGRKNLYEFKALTTQTAYLRVSSFDASLYGELDSFYKSIHQHIVSKPYLIIDVRGNGGGAESNYFPLLQYTYSDPVYPDVFRFFSTPENIKRFEESLARMQTDPVRYGKDMIRSTEAIIRKLQAAKPYTFLAAPAQTPITGTPLPLPKKVIILTDRGCASSCEAFVYNAGQSKKVETMGGNTGGYIGYGNVQGHQTPCFGYSFQSTTTRYATLYQYEFTGLPPKQRPGREKDWVQAAVDRLENGR